MAPNQGKYECYQEVNHINKKGSDKDQINYNLWVYIFSVINLMTLILCILTAVFIYTEDEPHVQDAADLCVRCSELKIHPDDQLQDVLVYGDICCVQPGHLEDFVHAFAGVWHRKKLNKENPQYKDCKTTAEVSPKPALKLFGARKSHADINPRKVHWDEQAFNRNPDVLFYSHGKIAVKKSGMFFIYGQMEYLCHFKKRDSMSHNVMQVARLPRKGREEIIMKTSSTPPDCNTSHPASYSSHVGTMLQLSRGDHIYAKVFCWDTVKNHSSLSFFGMHKVE